MQERTDAVILDLTPIGVGGDTVIQEQVCDSIRALYDAGLSRSAIASRLGLDRTTVRKYLARRWAPQRRGPRASPLDPFLGFIRARAPEIGYNGKVLLRELQAQGYGGSYAALARRIQPLREAAVDAAVPTLRFETEPGRQAQVDWGSSAVWIGEAPVRVHLFVMVLGFSRRVFVRAYADERLASLLDAHVQAFAYFGGRTEQILYDNPRTIVLAKNAETGEVTWNATFKDRMDFYGVDVKLCRYYRAQTKGKVESGVKYVKRNALAGRRFETFDALNLWLTEWALTVADERIHGTTHERPVERFARAEAAALVAVTGRPPTWRERVETRVVPSDAFVLVETNRYPVLPTWVRQTVQVRVLETEIVITSAREGEPALRFARLEGTHRTARWEGPPRDFARARVGVVTQAPRWDPAYDGAVGEVEVRSLDAYEALLEEVPR